MSSETSNLEKQWLIPQQQEGGTDFVEMYSCIISDVLSGNWLKRLSSDQYATRKTKEGRVSVGGRGDIWQSLPPI